MRNDNTLSLAQCTHLDPRTIYTAAETFLDYILCSDAVPDPNSGDRPQADIMTQHTDIRVRKVRLKDTVRSWPAETCGLFIVSMVGSDAVELADVLVQFTHHLGDPSVCGSPFCGQSNLIGWTQGCRSRGGSTFLGQNNLVGWTQGLSLIHI